MHETLFNYNIIKILGEGGMSRVYLGEDPTTHQLVAIKELLPNLAHSKDLRERFRREAQIMAKLDHPNIVKLLKFEETVTSFYLIMEYVDGMDLEQHIKEVTGPISEPKAIEIMSTLLDAFGYAHEKGVVHRDIKPANIIITHVGKVKVLDFGIAKIVDDESGSKTKTGTRIGTVAYMSPEQVNALPDIDLRTDIYSLGVLLHQIITGTAPYDTSTSSDFEVQTKIVKEPLPRANTIYPYVSNQLQSLIDKATQKKRENRFKDCDQFKLALLKKTIDPLPEPTPDENSPSYIWIIVLIIVIVFSVIIISLNNKKPNNSALEIPATESIAVDTVAVVDTTSYPPQDEIITETKIESASERTVNLPKYESRNNEEISILEIILKQDYTLIKLRYENQSNTSRSLYTGKPNTSDAFFIVSDNGTRYNLTWTDLGDVNEQVDLPNNHYYDFHLQFVAIPLSTSTFTLVEGTSNSWGFKNIKIDN